MPGLERPGRRFNIGDGLILVAAVALGLKLHQFVESRDSYVYTNLILMHLDRGLRSIFVVQIVATFALLVLRLRGPRPRLRRLARQPGFLATLSSALLLLIELVLFPLDTTFRVQRGDFADWIFGLVNVEAGRPGIAVAGAWLSLAVSRRWRPEPGWIDQAGFVVGLVWIVSWPVQKLTVALTRFY